MLKHRFFPNNKPMNGNRGKFVHRYFNFFSPLLGQKPGAWAFRSETERKREGERVLSARKGYLIFKLHVAERKRPPIREVCESWTAPELAGKVSAAEPLLPRLSAFAWDFISQDNEQFYKYAEPLVRDRGCRFETETNSRQDRVESNSRSYRMHIRTCARVRAKRMTTQSQTHADRYFCSDNITGDNFSYRFAYFHRISSKILCARLTLARAVLRRITRDRFARRAV